MRQAIRENASESSDAKAETMRKQEILEHSEFGEVSRKVGRIAAFGDKVFSAPEADVRAPAIQIYPGREKIPASPGDRLRAARGFILTC